MAKEIVCPDCQAVLQIAMKDGEVQVTVVDRKPPAGNQPDEDDLLEDIIGGSDDGK